MVQIILASESPRRKEIMENMGIPYKAVAANVEEVVQETEPARMVEALAKLKSKEVAARLSQQPETDDIIIGADTMVFYRGQALGKPKDTVDAARMLHMLSDDIHEVYTGVSIIIRKGDENTEEISFSVCTEVAVRSLTGEQIQDYIATGESMDKAGAYAIQGKFGIYIKEINGDYYNVVGFPIAKIYDALLQKGIDLKKL